MKNRHQRETELDDEIEAELHKLKERASQEVSDEQI
jgi:hypothetical protein